MVIQNLIQRELRQELQVQKDEEGRFTEYMNLDPFFRKIKSYIEATKYGNERAK